MLCSDHIALVKAFEGYRGAKRGGHERDFCWENFLSPLTLKMMEDMRNQFLDLLSDIGFVDKSRGPNVSAKKPFLNNLKAADLFFSSGIQSVQPRYGDGKRGSVCGAVPKRCAVQKKREAHCLLH